MDELLIRRIAKKQYKHCSATCSGISQEKSNIKELTNSYNALILKLTFSNLGEFTHPKASDCKL